MDQVSADTRPVCMFVLSCFISALRDADSSREPSVGTSALSVLLAYYQIIKKYTQDLMTFYYAYYIIACDTSRQWVKLTSGSMP